MGLVKEKEISIPIRRGGGIEEGNDAAKPGSVSL